MAKPKTEPPNGKDKKDRKKSSQVEAEPTTEVVYKDWKDKLAHIEIKKENFAAEIGVIVESSHLCFESVDRFIDKVKSIQQCCIKPITYDDTLRFINEKSHKGLHLDASNSSMLKKATTEVMKELKLNNYISPELQALLVKLQIIIIRDAYLSHKENYFDLQRVLNEERIKLLEVADETGDKKGGKGKKGKDKSKDDKKKKDKGKSKGKTKEDEDICDPLNQATIALGSEQIRKKMKNLNQSEHFILPKSNIDLYFVLLSFYEYDVLPELRNIGVETSILIDLAKDNSSFSTYVLHKSPFEDVSTYEQIRMLNISNFWRACGLDGGYQFYTLPSDMCYIRYVLPSHNFIETDDLYNDIYRILQNVEDLKRANLNYLEHVKVVNVEEKKPMKLHCMKTYIQIVDRVPNEFCTVPLIMNALIEETCKRVAPEEKCPDEYEIHKVPKPVKKYHAGVHQQIKRLFKNYENNTKENNINEQNAPKLSKTIPLLYGDAAEQMFAHTDFAKELKNITVNALKQNIAAKMFEFYPNNVSQDVFYDYMMHRFCDHYADVSVRQMRLCIYSYLFKHAAFHNMLELTNKMQPFFMVDKDIKTILFSNMKPYNKEFSTTPDVFFKFLQNFSSSDQTSCSFIKEENSRLTKDIEQEDKQKYCHYVEEYNTDIMLQMLNVAFNDFKFFDFKYFPPDDVLLLHFHKNPVEEENNASLKSPICFRDFCAHVITDQASWLLEEEKMYWDSKKSKEDLEIKNILELQLPQDFYIIKGSYKDLEIQEKLKQGKKSPKKGGKGSKGDKSSKVSKDTKKDLKEKVSSKSKTATANELDTLPPTKKKFAFEGYNLGTNYVQLFYSTKRFLTPDGMTLTVDVNHWSEKEKCFTLKVSANDNELVFNCVHEDRIVGNRPFIFHVNVANGIQMSFGRSSLLQETCRPVKQIVTYVENVSKTSKKTASLVSTTSKENSRVSSDIHVPGKSTYKPHTKKSLENSQFLRSKKDVIEKIKTAIKMQVPIFKIYSSALHKFNYVKRIKSHIEVPIGALIRRLLVKPKFYKPLQRRTIKVSKCIPVTKAGEKREKFLNFDFKASLPTGLTIQTVQSKKSNACYIRQKYIVDRSDLQSLKDELYRCILRCGRVLKFLKDGSVLMYCADKTIFHYEYGYFNSSLKAPYGKKSNANLEEKNIDDNHEKENEPVSKEDEEKKTNKPAGEASLENSIRLISFHKASLNLPLLEKITQRICKRYQNHMIDLSENYRFESKLACVRREHKVYRETKYCFNKNPSEIPLKKCIFISEEGEKFTFQRGLIKENGKKCLSIERHNYMTRESLLQRQDAVTWHLSSDGYATTQFPDNTRITSWCVLLDENFILEEDTVEPEYEEEEEDLSNIDLMTADFCSFSDGFTKTGVDSYDLISSKIARLPDKETQVFTSKTNTIIDKSYVVIGLSYKIEHPNYATTIYHCEDESSVIQMPDKVQVVVSREGSFELNLQNNDTIDINRRQVEYTTSLCGTCGCTSKCEIYILPLLVSKKTFYVKESDNLVYMKDRDNKVLQIDFQGNITQTKCNSSFFSYPEYKCAVHNTALRDRYFVLRRDMSGCELSAQPEENRFIYSLNNTSPVNTEDIYMPETNNVISTYVAQNMYKTYSERLMCLYDDPILRISEQSKVDEILVSYNFKYTDFIKNRSPIFLVERKIYHIPMITVVGILAEGVHHYLSCFESSADFSPSSSLISFLRSEKPAVIESPPKPTTPVTPQSIKQYKSKFLSLKENMQKYKDIIKEHELPLYFEILKGQMFRIVEECSENAMIIASNSKSNTENSIDLEGKICDSVTGSEEEKLSHEIIVHETAKKEAGTEVVDSKKDSEETRRTHSKKCLEKISPDTTPRHFDSGRLNLPNDIILHLKCDRPVHEIVLTSSTIKVITESTEDVVYKKSDLKSISSNITKSVESLGKQHDGLEQSKFDISKSEGCLMEPPSNYRLGGSDLHLCLASSADSEIIQKNYIYSEPAQVDSETRVPKVLSRHSSTEAVIDKKTCNCPNYHDYRKTTCPENVINFLEEGPAKVSNELQYFQRLKVVDSSANVKKLVYVIFKTIKDIAPASGVLYLNAFEINSIVHDKLRNVKLNKEEAKTLIKITESLLFKHIVGTNNETPYENALELIKHIQLDIRDTILTKNPKTCSSKELDDLANRIGMTLYKILDQKTESEIKIEVIDLLSKAQMSKSDASLVLELAAKKLDDDLQTFASDTSINVLKNTKIMSQTALNILESIDSVIGDLFKDKPKLFWPEFGSGSPMTTLKQKEQIHEIKSYLLRRSPEKKIIQYDAMTGRRVSQLKNAQKNIQSPPNVTITQNGQNTPSKSLHTCTPIDSKLSSIGGPSDTLSRQQFDVKFKCTSPGIKVVTPVKYTSDHGNKFNLQQTQTSSTSNTQFQMNKFKKQSWEKEMQSMIPRNRSFSLQNFVKIRNKQNESIMNTYMPSLFTLDQDSEFNFPEHIFSDGSYLNTVQTSQTGKNFETVPPKDTHLVSDSFVVDPFPYMAKTHLNSK